MICHACNRPITKPSAVIGGHTFGPECAKRMGLVEPRSRAAVLASKDENTMDMFEEKRMLSCAALFVQPKGCYAALPNIDAWPESRDARRYEGPFPVVAHPPCQLWGALAYVNYKRWGGDHNKPGNDQGCFAAALESVRRFGGVLEHPAQSRAFAAHGIPEPMGIGWQKTICGGWVCEVWQSAYGHRANKATWLYYCGAEPPAQMRWDRPIGTHQIGGCDQRGKDKNKPTVSKKEASATPIEFRDALIALAVGANGGIKC